MPENLDVTLSDTDLIRQLIKEEQDAIISYTERSEHTDDPKVKAVFSDIASEEKTHVGELQALLRELDPDEEKSLSEGANEVEEMDVEKAWEDFKKSNQTSVEDKLDTLLAIENDIRVDTERTAEALPDLLSDSESDETIAADEIEEDEQDNAEIGDAYAWMDDLESGNTDTEETADDESEPVGDNTDIDDVPVEELADDDEDDVIDDEDEEVESEPEAEPAEEVESEPEAEPAEEVESVEPSEDESSEEETPEPEAEPAEEAESISDSEPESDSEEPSDEEPDSEKKKEENLPTTKTIKSIRFNGPKVVVRKSSKPPYSITAGQVHKVSLDDILNHESEDVEMGHGVNPRDVVAKDIEVYNLIKRFKGIL